MGSHSLYIFLFSLLQAAATVAQEQPDYPRLYPSNVSAFDLEDGMPISCTYDGLFDQGGRLWVSPCFKQKEHRTINFYQFTGRESEVIRWDSLPAGLEEQTSLVGITEAGQLYGFFRWTNHFFFFDPSNRQTEFHQLSPEDVKIFFMAESPAYGMIVMAVAGTRQFIYQLKDGHMDLLLEYPFAESFALASNLYNFHPNGQVLFGEDVWFLESPDLINHVKSENQDFKLNRFNLREKQLKQYTYEDLFSGISLPEGYFRNFTIINSFQDKIIIADREYVFLFDPRSAAMTQLEMFLPKTNNYNFAFQNCRIEKDALGNTLFIQTYTADDYYGILLDTAGQLFDYTPVLRAAIDASRFPWLMNNNVWSKDFKRKIYNFHQGGIIAVDLQLYGSIRTYMVNRPTRGIVDWTPDKYLVRAEGVDNFNILHPDSLPFISKMDKQIKGIGLRANPFPLSKIIKSADGFWWYSSEKELIRMDAHQNYDFFQVGFNFDKFEFLDDKNLAIPGNDQLYLYNIDTQELRAWEEDGQVMPLSGTVNDMFLSKDSVLWIASLKGLWIVDLKQKTSKRLGPEHGFQDRRMMCIHQDEQNLFWIGTYGGGLHIYNPENQEIQVIDQSKGLSNNTVIGILADDDGDLWVSTFKGLNLVSPDGEVKAQLFEEDGLSTNEFNRYSYYKDDKGHLIFGSIKGVNLLEPAIIKSQLYDARDLKIYLTNITRFDPSSDEDQMQKFDFHQKEEIRLPATHRYVNIQFALSSLIRLEDQSYEYQIRSQDENAQTGWVYLGHEPRLTLQNLPPGAFDIVIRGIDYRGNESQQTITIPIRVDRFFYQQAWFYMLVLLIFFSLIAAWLLRQNSLRRALEMELKERTNEIMSTRDQLIAQENLASLGQVVAGIAHEIKNPLNFINNFSKVNRDLIQELKEALIAFRAAPSIAAYQAVEGILRDMDDASAGVINNGQRVNQIVRSMMDHARGGQGELRTVNLNELVDDNLNLAYHGFRALDPAFEVHLEKELDPKVELVPVYPQELGRALLNILNNAFFAINKRRKEASASDHYRPIIRVNTHQENGQVAIEIRDNGPGIPEAIKEKIFLPFFTTKSTGEGNTGLGLSISYDIITHLHQGQLTVESQKNDFTAFTICLPVK